MRFLRGLADSSAPGSAATRFRGARLERLMALLRPLPKPIRIIDVGGTVPFWARIGTIEDFDVTIVNLFPQESEHPRVHAVVGDARDLSAFGDASFDVAFSNSVIEHVPQLDEQCRVASELRRVGRRVWLQTPNRRFPLEPHFLFPFFQYLPIAARAFLLRRMDLGWFKRTPDPAAARRTAESIRLMTAGELRRCLPGASIVTERFLGLPKSFIVLDGWSETSPDPG